MEALEDRRLLTVTLSGLPSWVAQGPGPVLDGQIRNVPAATPLGDDPVSGAVHTVLADPNDADILYIGTTNGGIWRTTNATAAAEPDWEPLTDQFPSLSIGAMEFDDADATNQTIIAGIGHFSSWAGFGGPLTGLLKTTNGGTTWSPLGTADLSGRNISGLYARGNIIVVAANAFGGGVGAGVYRSDDGGTSFDLISGSNGLALGAAFDLVVDPTNTSRLYASIAGVGVFRSNNDGVDWTNVSQNDPAGLQAAIQAAGNNNAEMAVSPQSGRIYATSVQSGRANYIGYSDTQGDSWIQMDLPVSLESAVAVTNASNTTPIVITSASHGMSNNQRVRITGATGNTAANGEWQITLTDPDAGGPLTTADGFTLIGSAGNGVYGGGGVWQLLVDLNPNPSPGGQGGTHFSILVDPNNDDIVYIGGDRQDATPNNAIGAQTSSGRLFRGDASIAPVAAGDPTNEFSPQWEHMTDNQNLGFAGGGTATQSAPHADSREMVFDANGDLIETDDGGIYRLTSPTDNTGGWSSLIGDLNNTEFHDIAYDPIANIIFGGTQDIGTPEQISTGSFIWDSVSVADGGDVAVDALIGGGQSVRYTSTQNLGTFRRRVFDNTNTQVGATVTPTLNVLAGGNAPGFDFVTPVVANNVAANRLIIGGNNSTYESLDRGDNITEIGVGIPVNSAGSGDRDGSPVDYGGMLNGVANPDVLYVGSGSQVFLRTIAGGALAATAALAGAANIQAVKMHPLNWMTAYATDGARVYQTTNGGGAWDDITGDLVDGLLRSIEIVTNGVLDAILVGGGSGVHRMLTNALEMWSEFGAGLPNAPAWDLDYDASDDLLVVGTLGRGAWIVEDVTDAIFDKGVLQIDGDEDFPNQDDVFLLIRDEMNPTLLRFFVNGVEATESPITLDTIQQINVNGLGGNDTLIVDSTNGLITVDMGIRYNGGTGRDTLELDQTDGPRRVSELVRVGATPGSGIEEIVDGVDTQTVFFEQLEPIITNVPVVNFNVDGAAISSYLNGANQITYDQSDLFGATWGRITIDLFEPVHFTAKQIVAIDAENGNDAAVLNNGMLPTDLTQIRVLGDDGDDHVRILALPAAAPGFFSSVEVLGEAGNDTIDGSKVAVSTPLLLNGNEGDDTLLGGAGVDVLDGGADDDVLVASAGNDTLGGGDGVDQIYIIGRALADVITANQTAAATLAVTYNGDARTYSVPDVEGVIIDGALGDDTVAINVFDLLAAASSLPFEVIGNSPNASDRLIVNDDGLGDLVVHHEGPDGRSGSIVVGGFAPVDYHMVERVDVTPINAAGGTGTDELGRLIVFEYDDSESNDSRATATPLGVAPVFVGQRNIDPGGIALPPPFPGVPGDADWFRFRPGKIGTFRVEALFQEINTLANGRAGLPGGGDLSLEVYRANGTLIVASASIDDDESVDVSMAANTDYFIRVFGATANAINVYDLNVKEVDVLGPQVFDPDGVGPVTPVHPGGFPSFDLFDPKPTQNGLTPPITSIVINMRDLLDFGLEPRAPGDVYPALNVLNAVTGLPAASPEHYQVRGDRVGLVAIQTITVVNNPVAAGQIATATVQLTFAQPLPDDRYTLTVFDSLTDPAGNALDGGTNADEPQDNPTFPSGDGISGGDFAARFTVDSRPEIAAYIPQQITVDINGNFVWDPASAAPGGDASNVDLTFTMQVRDAAGVALGGFGVHDLVFAGRFFIPTPNGLPAASRFDQLAVYGNAQDLGSFRWLIDLNSDGVVNTAIGEILTLQPIGGLPGNFNVAGALPVAGNFDGNAANGDEIGLYYSGRWALDSNRNFVIDAADTFITNNLLGHPIVGDFDGDALDDLAVFNNNVFSFDLAAAGGGLTGVDATLVWGFPGVLDRPVAADMDRDGIDDIGLWVPRTNAQNPEAAAEWYFLLSNDFAEPGVPAVHVPGTIATLDHPFTPVPFGFDLYAEFGNERALPLVGNFDPPVAAATQTNSGPGDFDGNGAVDGADFLAWQRGPATASGLAEWSENYGTQPAIAAAAESTASSVAMTLSAETMKSAAVSDNLTEFNQLTIVATPPLARAASTSTARRVAAGEALLDAAFARSRWLRAKPAREDDDHVAASDARRRWLSGGDSPSEVGRDFKCGEDGDPTVEEWDEAMLAVL